MVVLNIMYRKGGKNMKTICSTECPYMRERLDFSRTFNLKIEPKSKRIGKELKFTEMRKADKNAD